MPFAGYEDFDDCVRKNGDKADPKAYCAAIMRQAGDPSEANSATRGAEDARRHYQGQDRRTAERRRNPYGTPGFLNRRKRERRAQ